MTMDRGGRPMRSGLVGRCVVEVDWFDPGRDMRFCPATPLESAVLAEKTAQLQRMVCGPQKRGHQERVKPNHGTRKKPAGFMPGPAGFMKEPAGFVACSEAHVPFFHSWAANVLAGIPCAARVPVYICPATARILSTSRDWCG